MTCKLGKALGCKGMDKEGGCNIYHPVGVQMRMAAGVCEFKNIRAAKVGINAPKTGKMRNPLKQAKMEARASAAAKAPDNKPIEKTTKA